MAKQLYIDLSVRANTQQAKTEFQSLQKSLSDVALQTAKMKDISVNSASLNKASAAAKELQRHLSNAVNVDTGKINLNKLNASLKASKSNIGDLSSSLLKAGGSGQEAFMKLAQSVANADRPLITMGSHLNNFLNTLKNTARWQISSSILHGFMGSLQKAYGYAQDLNKSLNNIRIVTGYNVDKMTDFAKEANNAAKALSTSTTAYTDAALIYYQQGLGDEKVKERTEATVKLANVSRQSAEEVSSQMTAIWNNFEQQGKAAEYYADVITALGAATASSSSEIAEGLQKFAAVADTVDLSYEKATASLATVVAETRQSADTVGTAFKTLFARLEGLSLGETLEDGTDLNKYSAALQTIGVNIKDQSGQLKSMDNILDEIGAKWETLGKDQKVALGQTVAGVRQYTQFVALMDNYDKVLKNQQIAATSEGTLQKQADTYAESWEASQKRVKASLESIYQSLIDDKFFIAMNNGFSKMLDGLNNFIQGIGGLRGVLISLGALFLNYISDKITPAVQNLKISLVTMFQSPEKQAKTYGKIMTDIMNAAKQNLGLNDTDKMTDSMKVQLNYIDKLSAAKNKLMAMDKKLSDSEKLQAEQELNLISLYQDEVQALADKLTKEKENVTSMMDDMDTQGTKSIVKQKRQFDLDANEGDVQDWRSMRDSYIGKNGEIDDLSGYYEAADAYEQAYEKAQQYKTSTQELVIEEEQLKEILREKYEEFVKSGDIAKEDSKIMLDLSKILGMSQEELKKFGDKTTSVGQKVNEANEYVKKLRDIGADTFPGLKDKITAVAKATNQYNQVMSNNSSSDDEKTKATNAFNKALQNLQVSLKQVTVNGKEYKQIMNNMGEGDNAKKIEQAYKIINELQEKLIQSQNRLNGAFNNFNPSHIMTVPEVFSKMASTGMQAAMSIRSITSLFENWDDLDPMERITQSLMTVGMVVPSIFSTFSNFKAIILSTASSFGVLSSAHAVENALTLEDLGHLEVLNAAQAKYIIGQEAEQATRVKNNAVALAGNLLKDKECSATTRALLAKNLENAAKITGGNLTKKDIANITTLTLTKGTEIVATEGATSAQWKLNAAMSANPVGAVIAAFVALVAVIALLVIAFHDVADASAGANFEKVAKKADGLTESATKLEEKAKAVKDQFDKYDSVVDKLYSCTKGTNEWRDALREVNKTALELARDYPDLLKNPNYFKKDDNGALLITDEGKEYVQDAADKAAMSAAYAATRATLDKDVAQLGTKYSDIYNATDRDHPERRAGIMTALAQNQEFLEASQETDPEKRNAAVKAAVQNVLQQYYKENNISNTEELQQATDDILSCGNSLIEFGTAALQASANFNKSTDLLISTSKAFDGTDAVTKNVANHMMNEAIQNKVDENNKKMNDDSVNKQAEAEKMFETYKKMGNLPADAIFDDFTDKDGELVIEWHSPGEESKSGTPKSFQEINEAVSAYEVGQHVDEYADKAKKAQQGYTTELKGFAANATASADADGNASWDKVLSNYTEQQLKDMMNLTSEDKDKSDKAAQAAFGVNAQQFWDTAGQVGLGDKKTFQAAYNRMRQFTGAEQSNLRLLDPNIKFDENGNITSETGITKDWTVAQKRNYTSGVANAKKGAENASVDTGLIDDIIKKNANNTNLSAAIKEIGSLDGYNKGDSAEKLQDIQRKYNLKGMDNFIEAVEKVDKTFNVASADISKKANDAIENSKKVKQDSSIKQDELDTYKALGVETEKYFTKMQDGTYKLTGSAKDFQAAVKEASQGSLFDIVDNYKKAKDQTTSKDLYASVDQSVFSNKTYDKSKDFDKQGELTEQGRKNTAARLDYASSLDNLDLTKVSGGQTLLDNYTKAAKQGDVALKQFWSNLTKEQAQTANEIIAVVDESFKDTTEAILATTTSVSELNAMTDKLLDSYGSYDYTAYAEQLKSLASQYDNTTKELEEYNEALVSGNKEQIEAAEGSLKIATMAGEAAQKYSLVAEDVETHARLIAKSYEKTHDGAEISAETAARLAIANERMNKGVKTLYDNWEKWSKTLKTANKASQEYAEALNDANEALADLTGAVDGASIPLDFLDNTTVDGAKHLNWMTQAAKGNTQAINNLGAALAAAQAKELKFKEYTKDVTTVKIDGTMVDLKDLETKFNQAKSIFMDFMDGYQSAVANGTTAAQSYIDNAGQDWINALNEMALATDMTTEEMQAMLNEMGVDAELTVTEKTVKTKVPQYTNKTEVTKWDKVHNYPLETKTSTSITGYVDADEVIQVPQINTGKDNKGKTAKVTYIGTSANTSSAGGVSSSSISDNSSSSSSDSSKKNTSAASHDHEVNRYSNEENAIKGLSKQYERLNDAKDKAFGMSRVQAMEQELKKLKQLKTASTNYLDAIVGKGNGEKVAKEIAKGGSIGSMVANGKIGGTAGADYKSLFSGASASGKQVEYTAKDRDGNEWLASSGYSLGAFNSMFGTNIDFKLDSFGNIQNKDSILNLIQKLTNDENSAYSSVADPTAASTTEHNKRIAYLEEIKERMEQYNSTAELMGDQIDAWLDYVSQIQEKNAEIITAKMETGVELGQKSIQKIERTVKVLGDNIYKAGEVMSTWFDASFRKTIDATRQQGEAYGTALKETQEKWELYAKENGEFNQDAISSADAAELFSSIEDGLDGLIDNILSTIDTMKEHYGNVLEYWNNKIDDVTSSIEHNANTLDHFQKVLGLLGRSADYTALGKVLKGQLDVARSSYNASKKIAQGAEESYQNTLKHYEQLKKSGVSQEALDTYYESNVRKAKEDYEEKTATMQSDLENVLEKVNAWYENEINKIFAESEARLTGKWGNFDALDSAMERQHAVAEEYLTKTNQLYETNTLLRKLSQDIDKTDSRIAKEKLKNFSNEIENMKQREKLSKTDLEIAKARYEVLQAQIALEEAQNAKSTVRLQRDNEGNYGYVYTADQDQISDAQQALEDKQNDLYNLVLEQTQQYGEKRIELTKEYISQINALEQERREKGPEFEEEYQTRLADIIQKYQELNLAYTESYTTAQQILNEVGAEGQTEAWTDSFDEIINNQKLFSEDSQGEGDILVNALDEKMNWLNQQRDIYSKEAEVGNKELQSSINEVTASTKSLENEVTRKGGLVDSMSKATDQADALTTEFITQYDKLQQLISKYQSMADEASRLYERVSTLTKAQREYNNELERTKNINYGGGGTGNYSGNGSGSGGSSGTGGGTMDDGTSYGGGSGTGEWKNTGRYQQIPNNINYHNAEVSNGQNTKWETQPHAFLITGPGAKTCKICGFKYTPWKRLRTIDGGRSYEIQNIESGKIKYISRNNPELASYGLKSGGYTGTWAASGKTGLYTGSWDGPDIEENGKLAFLHQKELVLNADDTENMLEAVKLIRQISQSIDLQAASKVAGLSMTSAQYASGGQTLQQEVTIHAEFPNATDHHEIEEAFNNLVNRASQYAGREY